MQQFEVLHQYLAYHAQATPEKCAAVFGPQRSTYAALNENANALARFLLGQGIRSGDFVVLLSENSINFIISWYAVLKSGAAVIPLNTGFSPEKIGRILEETRARAIIVSAKYEKTMRAVDFTRCRSESVVVERPSLDWDTTGVRIYPLRDILDSGDSSNPVVDINSENLCTIIYTSGSTGVPKGVMLTHKNLVANTNSICEYIKLGPRDIQMVVLPFYYVMGLSLLNTHIAAGGCVVVNNQFAFPAAVLNQMVSEKVTGFSGVPATYAYLLHRSPLLKYRDKLRSLRYCSQAGGHMPLQIKKQLREVLPEHTDIFVMYGATEASARLTRLDPEYYIDKMDSIGTAIPGVTMKVLDESGRECAEGFEGELVASGDNIMHGYFNDGPATKKVLDKNGYHTGDRGYRDKDGFLFVTGRNDNMLKVSGHRINPQEVEDVLMETGLLVEIAVVGIPDSLSGYTLRAVAVAVSPKTTEREILSKVVDRIPRYKMPEQIKLVKVLPKKGSGKVDREACTMIVKAE
ncbi:MAG: AMP-binding protein [Chitinivibrionales bacterium]|nr:AMP-binding protein [Chitinivibrionales bacterium]